MVQSIATNVRRVIIAKMEKGEDVLKTIEMVASNHGVKTGQLTLIGAIEGARLGYFDTHSHEYVEISTEENLEVVSCMGDITTLDDGSLVVHAHMIAADDKGTCHGGHLLPGCKVSVTIELVIFETDDEIKRARDERTGLNLMDIK
jgi:predicted DNA-binding protein with PD1-like motif